MNQCCIQSFVEKGVRERFRAGREGERHRCDRCGRWYVLRAASPEEEPGPLPPGVKHLIWSDVEH